MKANVAVAHEPLMWKMRAGRYLLGFLGFPTQHLFLSAMGLIFRWWDLTLLVICLRITFFQRAVSLLFILIAFIPCLCSLSFPIFFITYSVSFMFSDITLFSIYQSQFPMMCVVCFMRGVGMLTSLLSGSTSCFLLLLIPFLCHLPTKISSLLPTHQLSFTRFMLSGVFTTTFFLLVSLFHT